MAAADVPTLDITFSPEADIRRYLIAFALKMPYRVGVSGPNFSELVEAHYAALYRFALSLCRERNTAWDLTQQTFLLWGRKGHQLRDPTKAKTWLFSALYHEFLRTRKRDGHLVFEETGHENVASGEPAPEAFAALDFSAVQSGLDELCDEHRAALTLFYLRSHSYQEIAEILQLPIGTVMSRISRAKVALRARLVRTDEGVFLKSAPPKREDT